MTFIDWLPDNLNISEFNERVSIKRQTIDSTNILIIYNILIAFGVPVLCLMSYKASPNSSQVNKINLVQIIILLLLVDSDCMDRKT